MKRLLISLAVLLMLGIANTGFTDAIPVVTDPRYEATVWTQAVYNGSGSDIQSGLAVRWDINASANDMAMWVALDNSIADIRLAGVVPYGTPLLDGTIGAIIVKGPAIMYDGGNTTSAGTGVEADANGRPVDETLDTDDEALLGWAINADASSVANTALDSNYAVIFVQPTPGVN